MIDYPRTREEALRNALEAAHQGYLAIAQVWAQIAVAFPEGLPGPTGSPVETPEPPTAVLRSVNGAGAGTTIEVSATAWNVMRTLAAQYVNTSITREAVVNIHDDFTIGISETDLIMSEVQPGSFRVMLVPRT